MMKISLTVSKRIRFYTMMIACTAFLWMMVRNHWINLDTLGGYALLVIIVITLMVLAAAGVAWLIRTVLNKIAKSSSYSDSDPLLTDRHPDDSDTDTDTDNNDGRTASDTIAQKNEL